MARTDSRDTPLHMAARGQQPETILLLADNGASLHAINLLGDTPEFYATRPFDEVEINPEVAEVFHALRNRKTGAGTTDDQGKGAPDTATGSNLTMKEADRAGGTAIGLLATSMDTTETHQ